MMVEKRLGKIKDVTFGLGGHQDMCLGIHLILEGSGWGVCTSKDAWDYSSMEWTEYCRWTEDDRSRQYVNIMRYVSGLLKDAKVRSVDKLEGIPVEATFDGMMLKDWRILTEVL